MIIILKPDGNGVQLDDWRHRHITSLPEWRIIKARGEVRFEELFNLSIPYHLHSDEECIMDVLHNRDRLEELGLIKFLGDGEDPEGYSAQPVKVWKQKRDGGWVRLP